MAEARSVPRTTLPGAIVKSLALNSCEIASNARGEVSFTVKVYSADETDAADRARRVVDSLRKVYRKESRQ